MDMALHRLKYYFYTCAGYHLKVDNRNAEVCYAIDEWIEVLYVRRQERAERSSHARLLRFPIADVVGATDAVHAPAERFVGCH